jgi:hypothetical protein
MGHSDPEGGGERALGFAPVQLRKDAAAQKILGAIEISGQEEDEPEAIRGMGSPPSFHDGGLRLVHRDGDLPGEAVRGEPLKGDLAPEA